MTSGRVSGGPSRDADAPTRTTWTRDGIGAIVAVLALGLVFRLIIAQLNPGLGLQGRPGARSRPGPATSPSTASAASTSGPSSTTTRPATSMSCTWSGWSGSALGNIGDLIKIPPILADVALGWLVWSMVRELGGGPAGRAHRRRRSSSPTRSAGSTRSLWGQVDSFGVVFLLLGVRALWRDRPERAAIFTVIAALIKPQLAILAPIVAVVTIRRALWPVEPRAARRATRADAGDRRSPGDAAASAGSAAWERRTDHPIRILTTGVAGFLTAVVLCFPFGLSVIEPGTNGQLLHSGLVEQIFKTAGGYPYASVNAYNPWALASVDGTGVAANGSWACDTVILNPPPGGASCPEAVMIGPVSRRSSSGRPCWSRRSSSSALVVARRPTPARDPDRGRRSSRSPSSSCRRASTSGISSRSSRSGRSSPPSRSAGGSPTSSCR